MTKTFHAPSPILDELASMGVLFLGDDGLSLTLRNGALVASMVAPVTAVPPAGTYGVAQGVSLLCASADVAIYFTDDGTVPTPAATLYDGNPIAVAANAVLTAVAVQLGAISKGGAQAFAYTIRAAAPAFAPNGGASPDPISVTLSSTTPGAAIHYTTDGSAPTAASPLYAAPFDVAVTATVKAITVAAGYADSPVSSATFVIG